MIAAMTPRANMMNWASAMAIFTFSDTLSAPGRGVNPAIRSTSGAHFNSRSE